MRRLAITSLLLLSPLPARAVVLEVTVSVTRVNHDGFVEFKAESDEKGERATGHLAAGESRRFRWDMGSANQNIWYWWDTLDGAADLKVVVVGAPLVPVTLFQARCAHEGKGEVQVGKTLAVAVSELDPAHHHYRRRPDMPPYIDENEQGVITHIREANERRPRFGPDKIGNEWDLRH